MAGASKRVQLFYDVLSPYSWIGFEVLCRYQKQWNIKLELCPFFLSGIMKGSSNSPPGMVRAKGSYMQTDLRRLGEYFQIPLQQPKNIVEVMFQKGSLQAQRFLVATETACPSKVEALSRQLWMRVWSRDEDITEIASLRQAGEMAGINLEVVNQMVDMMQTEAVKEKLKQRTQEALDLGCFGAPFIVAFMEEGRKETFFGGDRFELMAHLIGEKWEGPLNELKAQL